MGRRASIIESGANPSGPPPTVEKLQDPRTNSWFKTVTQQINLVSGVADPTTANVPKGRWYVYKNTSSGEIRIWTNDNGTMKKSAAFT